MMGAVKVVETRMYGQRSEASMMAERRAMKYTVPLWMVLLGAFTYIVFIREKGPWFFEKWLA